MLGNFNTQYDRTAQRRASVDTSELNLGAWSYMNTYRTSYRDMSKKTPQKPKKSAIPGYSGFIPGAKVDNNFGKSFARTTREQLNRDKYLPERTTELFPKRPVTMSEMSRNLGRFGGGLDDEYHCTLHKYGASTIPNTHPNIVPESWQSITHSTYTPQEKQRPNMWRTTAADFWKTTPVSCRDSTKASGFVQNSTLFDGNGWLPIKELHGNNTETQYRKSLNAGKPFHPDALGHNKRALKRKELVY